jgi:hypothetical protein
MLSCLATSRPYRGTQLPKSESSALLAATERGCHSGKTHNKLWKPLQLVAVLILEHSTNGKVPNFFGGTRFASYYMYGTGTFVCIRRPHEALIADGYCDHTEIAGKTKRDGQRCIRGTPQVTNRNGDGSN